MIPSGTVTFLFTDIEGSTQLWEKYPEAMKDALAKHDSLLRSIFESHHGHVFKTIGDAFCVAFVSPSDALNASLEAQRVLQTESWGETPLKVRMALHTGEAQQRDGDYFGQPLNRVARLMSAGHGGQILISISTQKLIGDKLPSGVMLKDMGERRLKDLIRPERLFQAVAADLPQDFSPLKTLDAFRHNLPVQLTSFVGREKEIAEVKKLISEKRLVTLIGPGGTGKTRLSLQVGADVLDTFDDGVWFVELASVSDPALVAHAVAAVLSVREDQGKPLVDALQDYLRAKSLLLILDNCEHLIESCAELADTLLRSSPGLKIIVSSREALGIAGETSFRVPSLSLPDVHHLPTVEGLTQFDAVRLFIDRAVSVKSDFHVTNANAPAVAQVCHRLDGIPLAIELAAARVKGLSVEQIAARLDDRFRLLTGGSRTALPRQQTLRTSIDWSYDLLSEPERVLLRRLSVFVGDWSLEAVEAVTSDQLSVSSEQLTNKTDRRLLITDNILDLLLRLIDKSLVVEEERGGEARYRLLETIRQYARDKLFESGEVEQLRARHLEFFLKFAEEARPKLRSAEQLELLDRQRSEYENLRVAVGWAREGGTPISSSAEIGLRLISALEQLGDVYLLLGVGSQAVTFYQDAIALCKSLAGVDKMIALRLHGKIIGTVDVLTVEFERYKAFAKIGAASLASLKAELKLAENRAPDPEMVRLLTILSKAAWTEQVQPDWDTAGRYARAAVEMAEKLDNPLELSVALSALGDVSFARGLLREFVQVCLQRLTLSRDPRFSDARQRVSALIRTSYALVTVGEYAEAMPHLSEAASLAEQTLAVYEQRAVLQHSAYCMFRLDRWDEVLEILDRVRDIQKRYPRERAGPECFPIALAASVHTRRGESNLGEAEREEAQAIMTSNNGALEHWGRGLLH